MRPASTTKESRAPLSADVHPSRKSRGTTCSNGCRHWRKEKDQARITLPRARRVRRDASLAHRTAGLSDAARVSGLSAGAGADRLTARSAVRPTALPLLGRLVQVTKTYDAPLQRAAPGTTCSARAGHSRRRVARNAWSGPDSHAIHTTRRRESGPDSPLALQLKGGYLPVPDLTGDSGFGSPLFSSSSRRWRGDVEPASLGPGAFKADCTGTRAPSRREFVTGFTNFLLAVAH
ncbi:hypothetical protein MRX96_007109 [Rhipicephalus microplus]